MFSWFRLLILPAALCLASPAHGAKPNFLIILADDLGYGDAQCYNPERGRIPTPHIDRLAAEGMRFTDGHSSSGVCSPSRYALLTGRYHWRSRLQTGIVNYLEGPLIAPGRLTIGALAKQHGYRTACIGKWHLGWDWPIPEEQQPLFAPGRGASPEETEAHRAAWREVYAKRIAGGPTTRGFDEYFGTDVPNWPPYCFIENDRTLGIPTEFLPAEKLKNNLAGLGGPALKDWKLEAILPALGERAADFITRQTKAKQPWLLYLPLTSPHTPIAVNESWRGKSGLIPYADFVMETDAVIGRVLDALKQSGAADDTLVLLTSDNGCAPSIGVKEMEAKGHFPSGPLRGYKGDVFEGGHRVPFLVRWPGVVKPGSVCRQLVHQADLIATLADILGAPLPPGAGEDSFSLLPLLKGGDHPTREHAVSCASRGAVGLRKGPWKMVFERDAKPGTPAQLYDLDNDLGETKNLYASKPDLAAEMAALMERLVAEGRSTPGPRQANDVPVNWKRFMEPAGSKAGTPPAKAKRKAAK